MFKAEMEKSVQGILYTARDIWDRIGCMDDVVNLVRSAKMICAMYDLEMLEDVLNHIRVNHYYCVHGQADHLHVSFCNTMQGIEITVIDMNTYQGRHFLYSDMVKEISNAKTYTDNVGNGEEIINYLWNFNSNRYF